MSDAPVSYSSLSSFSNYPYLYNHLASAPPAQAWHPLQPERVAERAAERTCVHCAVDLNGGNSTSGEENKPEVQKTSQAQKITETQKTPEAQKTPDREAVRGSKNQKTPAPVTKTVAGKIEKTPSQKERECESKTCCTFGELASCYQFFWSFCMTTLFALLSFFTLLVGSLYSYFYIYGGRFPPNFWEGVTWVAVSIAAGMTFYLIALLVTTVAIVLFTSIFMLLSWCFQTAVVKPCSHCSWFHRDSYSYEYIARTEV